MRLTSCQLFNQPHTSPACSPSTLSLTADHHQSHQGPSWVGNGGVLRSSACPKVIIKSLSRVRRRTPKSCCEVPILPIPFPIRRKLVLDPARAQPEDSTLNSQLQAGFGARQQGGSDREKISVWFIEDASWVQAWRLSLHWGPLLCSWGWYL